MSRRNNARKANLTDISATQVRIRLAVISFRNSYTLLNNRSISDGGIEDAKVLRDAEGANVSASTRYILSILM